MSSRSSHDAETARLSVAVILFLASLLAVMPAQTYDLWKASVAGAEWGHFIAVAALVTLLIPGWWRSITGQLAGGLTVVAIFLALTPAVRAYYGTRGLDAQLNAAFGDGKPPAGAVLSSRPFAFVPLFVRPRFSGVDVKTLRYATRDDQPLELDLYRRAKSDSASASSVRAPLVVTIHGGSWSGGTRADLPEINYYLATRGYAVAALSYRLAPDHPFPSATEDVNAAIDYLKKRAPQLGLDSTRVVLLGRSAGGQLALQSAYTKLDPSIKGVIALYAPTDQRWGWDHPANLRVFDSYSALRTFLHGEPSEVPEAYKESSPINYIGSSTIPTLLIHGGMDPIVSVRQSERLDSALAAAGRHHYLLQFPWATHGCDYVFNGPCGQVSTFAIERFLATVTGGPISSAQVAGK